MAYITDFANATNGDLLHKIQVAICSAAIDVQAEAVNTAFHTQRSQFAYAVLANPIGYSQLMAYGMCADAAIDTSSTDSAIKTRASSLWNAYAVNG